MLVRWLMAIFVDDYFLIILEEKESVDNTMDFIQIFNEALGSKLQVVKTQCYSLAQENSQG
jgi:hypothetical protein